jgi:pimeloyl-ACP methyl ester carboxylesterase
MSIPTREPSAESADRFLSTPGVNIHYLDAPGGSPPIVMLHGLSANAHCFAGLIAAGLSPTFRVVAPDLRGRGRTDKPATGYTMADHAGDVLALLDALGLERVILAGHSFGGYVAIYLASRFPERFEKLIVIDAAITLNPRVNELLKPSLDRLTRISPSVDAYVSEARDAPHLAGFWDDQIERFFRAEIQENADGTAQSATSASAIGQSMHGLAAEPWLAMVKSVRQPVLFFNALGAYGPPGTPALVEAEYARATADAFPNVRYVVVPGNHMTMVFGPGAVAINNEIERFVHGDLSSNDA